MKKIIFRILTLMLFGCSGPINENNSTEDKPVDKTESSLANSQAIEPTIETKEKEIDS
jgi:hypothetical protein